MGKPMLRIREVISRPLAWGLGLIPPLLFLGLWWFVTRPRAFDEQGQEIDEYRLLSPLILPSPGETVAAIPSLWVDGQLSRSALCSLGRVSGGYLIAVALALPLGISMGSFTKIKAMFNPLMVAGTYLPLPAISVLIMPWAVALAALLVLLPQIHAEAMELQKYLFLAIVTFVVLLPQIVLAIENVENIYLQTAYTQGASRWHAVWKVLIPVALPDLYTALRTSFAVGWTYIILAEIVATDENKPGLGYLIRVAERRGQMERIYLVVLTIMLIGFVLDKFWAWGGRWLFPYRAERG